MPFTTEEFLHVFYRYNSAIWPVQILIYLPVMATLLLIPRKTPFSDGFASVVLAISWILAGVGYHILFFSVINTLAYAFGILFLLEAFFLLFEGALRRRVHFEYQRGAEVIVGWGIVIYSMIIYPALGVVFGHRLMEIPMFGVAPCPITIFTFGALLWATRGLPGYLLVIPSIWCLIATTAAFKLSIYQDFGLLLSGLISVPLFIKSKSAYKTPDPVAVRN